jgi:hypothetical protein
VGEKDQSRSDFQSVDRLLHEVEKSLQQRGESEIERERERERDQTWTTE